MKRLLVFLIFASACFAQQPQTQTAPIYAANAKYTNGVAPGYAPTAGSGLTLNLGGGTAYCGNVAVPYAAGTLTMTNSTTNYVYLDTTASCAPASNTVGFSSTTLPIATVVTSGGAITSITDDRTMFFKGNATIASGTYIPAPISRRWMYSVSTGSTLSTASAQVLGDAWTTANGSGSTQSSLAAYASGNVWFKTQVFSFTTGTASGDFSYAHGGLGAVGWPSNVLFETTVSLSTITSIRFRAGLCLSNNLCYSSDMPNLNMATFRFSTAASDTDFMCETGDGSSEQVQSSGVAPVASSTNNALATTFRLQIVANDSVPNVAFYINGSLVCTNTSHLPTSDIQMLEWISIDPTASVTAQTLWFPYMYVEADDN